MVTGVEDIVTSKQITCICIAYILVLELDHEQINTLWQVVMSAIQKNAAEEGNREWMV